MNHEPVPYGMDYNEGLRVTRVEVQYMQQQDEALTISSEDEGAGMYFRIKTEGDGFALESADEMARILADFMRRVGPITPESK